MNKSFIVICTLLIGFVSFQGCGPTQEEIQAKEKAKQDSLAKVEATRVAQMEADRQAQLEAERLAAIEAEKEKRKITFKSDGKYTIQVEASRGRETAESLLPKWKKRGYPDAYVVEFGNQETGEVWYRLRLGRFGTKAMADKAARLLYEDYKVKAWVTNFVAN